MHATMQATKIIVERRFPLDLRQSISSIRELYETGKRERWDPDKDVPWDAFDRSAYGAATLDAARRVWSRRAWIEYTGLAETPALGRGGASGAGARQQPLQLAPYLQHQQLPDRVGVCHDNGLAWQHQHQPLALELDQRLAHRAAADIQHRGQLFFAQRLAGLEAAVEDRVA